LPCPELRFLQLKFSTGLRLCELRSVASVTAALAGLPQPSRTTRRSYALLVAWFKANWAAAMAVLPLLQLRDSDHRVIDGRREMCERGIIL
jgi:hypothetical protein